MTERVNEDVFPTVSVDIAYGEKVWDFDVDIDSITRHLRSRGMSDEQIRQLSIHFSPNKYEPSDKKERKRQKESKYETLGQFFEDTSHIDVHKPQSWFAYYATGGDLKGMGINADTVTSSELSGTLVHELEHFIQTADSDMQKDLQTYEKWRKKLLRGKLFDIALKHMVVFGGITMSSMVASEAMEKGLQPFGNDVGGASSLALSVATLGAYFVASRLTGREIDERASSFNRESYLNRPTEVGARYAEEDYPLKLVTIETIPTPCETYDDVINEVQNSMTKRILDGIDRSLAQTAAAPLK